MLFIDTGAKSWDDDLTSRASCFQRSGEGGGLSPRTKVTKRIMLALTGVLRRVMSELKLQGEEAIQVSVPHTCEAFGSMRSGFGTIGSDLDLNLQVQQKPISLFRRALLTLPRVSSIARLDCTLAISLWHHIP
eukprot:5157278-Amphidinium_carterae.1